MSNIAVKNQRLLSRCMTIFCLDEPFAMASTRLWLSHLNSTFCLASDLPHTAQLNTMGASSLAIMSTGTHSGDQGSWNHWPLKCAPQPQVPEASVWTWLLQEPGRGGVRKRLNVCHHCRSDLNYRESLV